MKRIAYIMTSGSLGALSTWFILMLLLSPAQAATLQPLVGEDSLWRVEVTWQGKATTDIVAPTLTYWNVTLLWGAGGVKLDATHKDGPHSGEYGTAGTAKFDWSTWTFGGGPYSGSEIQLPGHNLHQDKYTFSGDVYDAHPPGEDWECSFTLVGVHVPEPSTLTLVVVGAVALIFARRRR
jgi:hypothetical protein